MEFQVDGAETSLDILFEGSPETLDFRLVTSSGTLIRRVMENGTISQILSDIVPTGRVYGLYAAETTQVSQDMVRKGSLLCLVREDKDGQYRPERRVPAFVPCEICQLKGSESGKEDARVFACVRPDLTEGEFQVDVGSSETVEALETHLQCLASDTGEPLENAVLELVNTEGETDFRGMTGKNGLTDAVWLSPGDYTLSVLCAPEGYEAGSEASVSVSDSTPVCTVSCDPAMAIVQSVDAYGHPVAGAVFSLVSLPSGSLAGTAVTGDDGIATIRLSGYGNYLIHEAGPLPGYCRNTKEVRIEVDGLYRNPGQPAAIFQEILNHFIVRAEDPSGFPVQGARFTLYDSNGSQQQTVVTDEHGRAAVYSVPCGSYSIRQTEARMGYLTDPVSHLLVIGPDTLSSDDPLFTSVNPPTSVTMKATDTSGNPVEGAVLALIRKDTAETIMSAVSDREGHVVLSGFGRGEYLVRETAAPDGYLMCRDYDLSVTPDWTWTGEEPAALSHIPNT